MPVIFKRLLETDDITDGVLIEYADGQTPEEGVAYRQDERGKMRLRITSLSSWIGFGLSPPKATEWDEKWKSDWSLPNAEEEEFEEEDDDVEGDAGNPEPSEVGNKSTPLPTLKGTSEIIPEMTDVRALSFFGSDREFTQVDLFLADGGESEHVSLFSLSDGVEVIPGAYLSAGFELSVYLPTKRYERLLTALENGADVEIECDLKYISSAFLTRSWFSNDPRVAKFLKDASILENSGDMPKSFLDEKCLHSALLSSLRSSPVAFTWSRTYVAKDEEETLEADSEETEEQTRHDTSHQSQLMLEKQIGRLVGYAGLTTFLVAILAVLVATHLALAL